MVNLFDVINVYLPRDLRYFYASLKQKSDNLREWKHLHHSVSKSLSHLTTAYRKIRRSSSRPYKNERTDLTYSIYVI